MIALSVGRSLSSAGVTVYGLGHRDDPLRLSRCRHSFTAIASGAEGQRQALRWLEHGPLRGVILPCSDEALELIARNRPRLLELGYAPMEANDEALLAMLDKGRSYELARRIGVDAPRTANVLSGEEVIAAAEEIGYPCALKPLHSHHFARRFGLRKKAFVVEDRAQLMAAFGNVEGSAIELMVTEIIPGPDDAFASYYGYLDEAGQPLLHLTKRKLRQWPPRFGLGSYHLTDNDPEVVKVGLRFLQGAGIRGLACVEFKRDERDGRLRLIECNHRLTAATEQLRRAGADLPLFAYSRMAGLALPVVDDYRTGVGYWFPLADARAFLEYRRHGELTFRRWARSLMHRQSFPLASIRDPLPSLGQIARRASRRLGG